MRDAEKQIVSSELDKWIEEILRTSLVHFSGTLAVLTLFGTPDKQYAVTTYEKSPPIDWERVNDILAEAQKARPQMFGSAEINKGQKELGEVAKELSSGSLDLIVSSPLLSRGELIGVVNIFGEHSTENLVISDPYELFEGYLSLAADLVKSKSLKPLDACEGNDAEGIITELPIGLLLTDPDGVIVRINNVLADMLDVDVDYELGKDIRYSTIFGPKRVYHYAKLLERGIRFEFINRYATPLGGELYMKIRGYLYPRGGDTVEGMLILTQDITEEIETRRKLTQREKKHFSEIKLAKELQQDFFPISYQKKRIKLATKLISARELAGDFFDIFDLGPNSLGVVMGDVVGKGIPASLMAMSVLGMISNAHGKMTSPKDVMEKVNAELVNRVKGDYWYATAFYAKIHVEKLTVTFARAGHELPIWWSQAEGRCRFLEGSGLPLGMFNNTEFETCQVEMGEGDKLVIYTDGLCDATNDEGERFGNERLVGLVNHYATLSAKNLLKVIELNVTKFMGSHPQTDDMALAIISVVPDSWNRLSIPPYTFNEVLENIIRELTVKNVSDDIIFKVRLSLDECITNAIRHGHRSNYLERVLVNYLIDSEKIVIQVTDRGEGFDYASIPDPTLEVNIQYPYGRGVYITMQLMDQVEFNDVGNQVTITKYLHGYSS